MWPEQAACEAALDSGYGQSQLAIADKNLFGMKQHQHPIYGTHVLPTKEFLDGKWVTLNSSWITYPDWPSCFADRMATLSAWRSLSALRGRLAPASGPTYVMEVSATWWTDPARAEKVLAIYDEMAGDWHSR